MSVRSVFVITHWQRQIVCGLALVIGLFVLANPLAAATFRHPSGIGFDYPDNWTMRTEGELLVLSPPGAARSGKAEAIVVGSEGLSGISDPLDPRVLGWFDQQVGTLVAKARRQGQARRLSAGSAQIDYQSPDGRRHHVRYLFKGNVAIFVAHFGATARHQKTGAQIFASIGGEFARDPRLVGTWRAESSSMTDVDYNSNTGGSSYVSSNSVRYYQFGADGRVMYQSSSSIYAQGHAAGGTSTASSSGANKPEYGTYAANGKQIFIQWDDGGTTEINYSVFSTGSGPALKLINPDTKKHSFWRGRG